MSIAIAIVLFIAALFFVITCHEFGHFLATRRAGVVVEEFGIGFPPRLFAIKRGDTEYSFNLIPLGAFVRPTGESDPSVPGGLAGRGPWTRMGVYAAGPLVNVLLAFLFLSAFFLVPVDTIKGQGVMIHAVSSGSPAEDAGIEPGDILLKIDGQEITEWSNVQNAINNNPTQEKSLVVQRDGGTYDTALTPEFNSETNRYIIGVTLCWGIVTNVETGSPADAAGIISGDTILGVDGKTVYSQETLNDSLDAAKPGTEVTVVLLRGDQILDETLTAAPDIGIDTRWVNDITMVRETISIWQAMWRGGDFMVHIPYYIKESIPLIRQDPGLAVVGPIGAGQLTVEAVKSFGYSNLLLMGGLISMGLALFNFLPIPPLDGGGMLIALIEGIRRGKRLSPATMRLVYILGTAFMITLFVVIFYSDIARLIRGEGFGL
jgi:regulator of sigma E protease